MSEQTDHQALARFLKIASVKLPDLGYVWHTANESAGGAKSKSGIPLDVLRESQMGTVPGVWDWLYLGENLRRVDTKAAFHFKGVAIELKSSRAIRTANQGLSSEQQAWCMRYMRNGWYTAVFSEWTDAARLLISWVGGNIEDFRF